MTRIYGFIKIYLLIILGLLAAFIAISQETRQLAVDKPQAIADLRTNEGAALVNAKWYVQNANIVTASFHSPGPSVNDALLLYPTGAALSTHQLHPQIGSGDFEKGFREIMPAQLESRQGTGLFSFVWYKVELTIPATIGHIETKGTTA